MIEFQAMTFSQLKKIQLHFSCLKVSALYSAEDYGINVQF